MFFIGFLLFFPGGFFSMYLMAKFLHDTALAMTAIVETLNAKFAPLAFHAGWTIRYGAKGRRSKLWHIDVVVPAPTAAAIAMPIPTNAMMVDTTGDGRPDQVVQMAPAQPPMVIAAPIVVEAIPVQANRV